MQNKIRKFFSILASMEMISLLIFFNLSAILQPSGLSATLQPLAKIDENLNQNSVITNYPTKNEITKDDIIARIHFWSNFYGINPEKIKKTIECESSFNTQAIGDGGKSYGLTQIYLPAHPEITKEQALDPEWAIKWMAEQFSKGKQNRWTCYRKLYKKGDLK